MARRAKRSPKSQAEDTTTQSVRRRKHAETTGAEADAKRQKIRERNRDYMRRYRERLRVQTHRRALSQDPIVDLDDFPMANNGLQGHLVDNDYRMHDVHDAPDVQTLSPYLPPHQQQAVYDFLDCLHLIQDDVHECTTCLERYHGMQMRATECARCHNEVCAPSPLGLALVLSV